MTACEVLEIKDLTICMTHHAQKIEIVKDVSFCLQEGKTLAIVGESGSGKTTCAMSIINLLSKNLGYSVKGSILYRGRDLLNQEYSTLQKIRGKEISIIFQDPSQALNPVFTVGSQIAEVFQYHEKMPYSEVQQKTFEILHRVGFPRVDESFSIYPHQISGGMKQRVIIAMACALNPKILIADEPTTALDVSLQKEILGLLKELQKETKMALLLITHDMSVVRFMADTVAVMYSGSIVEHKKVHELFENPQHPYTQALLASRPRRGFHKKPLPTIAGMSPMPSRRPNGCSFHPRCPYAVDTCRSGEVYLHKDSLHGVVSCWLYAPEKLRNE